MLTQNLGFPRIGANRELKKACENYWAGKINQKQLIESGKQERLKNWKSQIDAEIDIIPCNDFSFYDQVLDMTFMLGAIPTRYKELQDFLSEKDLYFAMCRGYQNERNDVMAMEMTKWFDTNYHYIVPEVKKDQSFKANPKKVVSEFLEAKEFGIEKPKPVLIGPVTYLKLSKTKEADFDKLQLINKLLPEYLSIIDSLVKEGCQYIQIDEPCLVCDVNANEQSLYNYTYKEINKHFPDLKIILTTYFSNLGSNTSIALNLPIYALHVDLIRAPEQLQSILTEIPEQLILSLGLIDGRNIWKNDFEQSIKHIKQAIKVIGSERVWIAPSCSLLHCPYDLELEKDNKSIPDEIKNRLAFAKQKLNELTALKEIMNPKENQYESSFTELILNSRLHAEKKSSKIIHNQKVKDRVDEIMQQEIFRDSPYHIRKIKQKEHFKFNLFPTTTIGSFPQTQEVRKQRRAFKKGEIPYKEYESFIKKEIQNAVKWQEEIGIDVLVHGEFERNDMVEYFGEMLEGFAFTKNGWVQSYGSRGVKPPIIYGDVSRKEPMTLKWTKFAQSLTKKKMKGILTGPVTMLQWSFVRDDQPRMLTAYQIANAIRDEVLDLEKNGIEIIQIDEPALREGLPLKKSHWKEYLEWAVKAFRICYRGVKDETQIHTHMCYAEFNDIIDSIADMDADVITIETSRSQMELMEAFANFKYPNDVGPGVYDVHSPRIPTVEEMVSLIEKASNLLPAENLWVNPDCGLKTRNWEEVKPSLLNMVKAALVLRAKL